MIAPSKNAKLGPSTEATTSKLLERAQSSLARCLILLNNIDGPYFYEAIGSSIIPGSLSHLLCIKDTQLMAIYQSCGFYSVKRDHFIDSIFQAFIEALDIPIGITRYRDPKKRILLLLIKIGQGAYPANPLQQKRDQLQPPNHHLKKEERQLVASLLKLCCKDADTHPLTPSGNTSGTPISDATAESSSTSTNASSKMCQRFNIRTPDKPALVMELVRDMKSPEKVPVRRQLLGGPNVTIHSLNNKMKKYIHIPQCKDGASADTALRKYKVVEQIVETVGSGIKAPEGLDVGAL
jgi:hypothetical protein